VCQSAVFVIVWRLCRYNGAYVRALLSSPHLEAAADTLSCSPPAPPHCITHAQQLLNWQFLAESLNKLMGTDFAIPSAL
jgi:hypothetical protein